MTLKKWDKTQIAWLPPPAHLLLPMSMMTMLLLLCCLASSSQVVRWLKVSRLVMSYTSSAPAAPR